MTLFHVKPIWVFIVAMTVQNVFLEDGYVMAEKIVLMGATSPVHIVVSKFKVKTSIVIKKLLR